MFRHVVGGSAMDGDTKPTRDASNFIVLANDLKYGHSQPVFWLSL